VSVLIKAAATQSVRPYLQRNGAAALAREPVEDPRVAALERENDELRKTLADSLAAAERAEEQAREDGKNEALAAERRDEEKRLAALDRGIAAALEAWGDRLKELDGLSALLTRTALAKLFDETTDHSGLVLGMIARQMHHLRRETLLAVRVSPHDFPDQDALDTVAAKAGTGSVSILVDPDLAAGDCRLDLQLGHVDIGPRAQWPQLAALLEAFETRESGA
jgi:flagellar biosynthesis/type III secretory pathway protein FliH